MKTLWLKVAGGAILVMVVALVIFIIVFWSSKSESLEAIHSVEAGRIPPTKAERLYQMALREKNASSSSERKYQIVAGCCRQILELYPDSPQAEKAKELLQDLPEKYQKKYADLARPLDQSKPKVKKSRRLRRRLPRRDDEWYIATYDEPKSSN